MSWSKDYFSFSKRERNAFIAVIILIGGFIFLPDFFSSRKAPAAVNDEIKKDIAAAVPSSKKQDDDENGDLQTPFAPPENTKPAELFTFDPNTLDEEGFIRLGLPGKTAKTIINYRDKGGKFRMPEDLRKIYSLKKEDADRIIPYARISSVQFYPGKYSPYKNEPYKRKTYTVKPIDINTATVEEWKSLPGIGEVLSARIVQYREKISGFSSVEQVAKTYGLKDSTFQLIKPYLQLAVPAVNKININTAYENELMECPAINTDIAKAIVIYRKQHGNFQSVEDLKKIVFISEEMFLKIAPFIKIN